MVLPGLCTWIEEQYDFPRVGISCLGMHPFFAVAARTSKGKARELGWSLLAERHDMIDRKSGNLRFLRQLAVRAPITAAIDHCIAQISRDQSHDRVVCK